MSLIYGFMVPHPPIAVSEIGGGEELKISSTLNAFDEVAGKIAELKPDTIILTSPHQILYSDYFHISPGERAEGSFADFRHPEVRIEVSYDTEIAEAIASRSERLGIPAGFEGERKKTLDHGTMVPLYFINKRYTGYKLVRIGLSGLTLETHYNFGRLIRSVCDNSDKRVIFVASGDLSHCQKEDGPYGFRTEGPLYDERLMDVMGRGAFNELLSFDEDILYKSQECGHRSFVIMAGAFDADKIEPKILSHEATFGVGYGIGMFEPMDKEDEDCGMPKEQGGNDVKTVKDKDPYVELAKRTVREFVLNGHLSEDECPIPEELKNRRAGAFVSIHECGMLRGCIGTIMPTCGNLYEEIRQNAVSACSRDPRFKPVEKDELDALTISVDVLGDIEEIGSKDELDAARYGVIVESGYKRGLLLPDLEGVDTVDEQIMIAKRKAGISAGEEVRLSRFEVIRHE